MGTGLGNVTQRWQDAEQWEADNGPARTRYCMELLVQHLPPAERGYLGEEGRTLLEWGCACGEGIDVLHQAFPHASLSGLDFAADAIQGATRNYPFAQFVHAADGAVDGNFDAIVTTCLGHVDAPQDVIRQQIPHAKQLVLGLLPGDKSDSFPTEVAGFRRVHCEVLEPDGETVSGPQLLVIYASQAYANGRSDADLREREREKWDDVYRDFQAEINESPAVETFNTQFTQLMTELLPEGASVLEAGCGGASQSIALAGSGQFDVHVMDFSENALEVARKRFAAANLPVGVHTGDVYTPGEAEHDLVFNAGVLEHYTFEQQTEFLRGMASRSRDYVLVLVPNRLCYWYWLWRIREASQNNWPYGKEVPVADLREVFEAAGLNFLGHAFLGETWSHEFINNLVGLSDDLRQTIIEIHDKPLVPRMQRAYLLAALGSRKKKKRTLPKAFQSNPAENEQTYAELSASIADATASRIHAERELSQQIRTRDEQLQQLQERLAQQEAQAAQETGNLRMQIDKLHADLLASYQRAERAEAGLHEQVNLLAQTRTELENAVRAHSEAQQREAENSQQAAQLQERIRELEELAARLEATIASKSDEANQQAARVAEAEAQASSERTRANSLERELHEISSSMGWVMMQAMRRVRLKVAPDGSLPHRAMKRGFGGVRNAWQYARGGLGKAWSMLGLPEGMTWYAFCFDRFKRDRAAGLPGKVSSVRPPYETGLVSVILPVYNGEDYVRESIDSVLAQTHKNWELVIVNDGSKDATPQIIDEYAAKDKRIRVVHQVNQKLPRALNNGFREARGEFLTWTSADNRFKPRFLEKMTAALERHPQQDLIYANQDIINEHGEPLRESNWWYPQYQVPPGSEHIHLPEDTGELSIWPNNFVAAAFMYRARVPYLIGEYGPDLFGIEDYDYWVRIHAELTLRHADFSEPVYDYRIHSASLTSQAEELGINPARDRMMVFDDFRRSFYLSPSVWCIEGEGALKAHADSLRGILDNGGDQLLERSEIVAEELPRLWLPLNYIAFGGDPTKAPPSSLPEGALRVVVQQGDASRSSEVHPDWDLCVALGERITPTRTTRPWQGWIAVPNVNTLHSLIDIRGKAKQIALLEDERAIADQHDCDISVVVCAYKRLDRLERTLVSLAEQDVPEGCRFEVILVNNDPEDPGVPELATRLQQSHYGPRNVSLKRIDCPLPGLSHARNAGISESCGDLLCFVDDDAVTRPGWLQSMFEASQAEPDAGVIGGRIVLQTPDPEPEWLSPEWYAYWSHFNPQYEQRTVVDNWWEFPWGANWAARREALLTIGGFRTNYGRKGNDFGGGEELVSAQLIRAAGYKVVIEPRSEVTHDVEPSRFTMHHVERTIRSAVNVNYRTQVDLHLPMEASIWGTLRHAYRNFNGSTAFRLPPGEARRRRSYAAAYLGLAWRQLGDRMKRLRKPLVKR